MLAIGKKLISCSAAVLISVALTSPVAAREVIQIAGTGTGIGVMKLLGAAYEKKHPEVRIEVLPSMGTPGGIKAVLDGVISLAIAGRSLNDEEQQAGVAGVEFARTPFVFVTHKNNPQEGITSDELVSIFSLKTLTWKHGGPIRLVLRPAREASSMLLKLISPEMEKAMAIALAKEGMIFASTDQDSADLVARTQGSLGTSTLTQIITEKLPIKILSLNGQMPNTKSLANGSYKLFKPLYVITSPRSSAAARRFAEYVGSAGARAIIEKSGNVAGPFH